MSKRPPADSGLQLADKYSPDRRTADKVTWYHAMQSDVYDVYCTQASNSVHISTDCKNIKDRKSSVAKERVRMDNSMIRVLNFQPSSGKLTPKTPSQTVRDVLKISGHGQDCQPPKHGSNMDQTWLVYDQLDEQLDAGPLVHQWLEAFPYFTE